MLRLILGFSCTLGLCLSGVAAAQDYYALFVRGDSPWKTVQDLVAYAKAKPNQLVTPL